MKFQLSGGSRMVSVTAATLLALAGCAATQDAAAPDGADTGTPAASASLVGDTNGPVQPIPTSCSDGHLSLQLYNNTGNTATLSTSQPPSEDDGGIYIDDSMASCTWPTESGPWSTTGAWMMVNTSNVTGEGEMSSEIYWNLDDQGDVLHAHGWGDYNAQGDSEGTDSTAGSCEITGPNASDFNCHEHNEWMKNWDHGFIHFTLTCSNPSSSSACLGYKHVVAATPKLSISGTTITDNYIQYPSGASNSKQYYMDQSEWVSLSYVFPDSPAASTGYQVYFSGPPQFDDGRFAIGYDTCTGNTFIAVPDGGSSQIVCGYEVTYSSPYDGSGALPGSESTDMAVIASGTSGGPPFTQGLSGIVGTTTEYAVALPGAVTGLSVSSPQTTASVAWDTQDPENAPVSHYSVTATPMTPTATPTPKPTGPGTTRTCSTSDDPNSPDYKVITSCTIGGLVAGIPYSFTVVPANFVGSGPASNPVVLVPGEAPQAAPTGLSGKYSSEVINGNNQYTAVLSFTPVPSSAQGSSPVDGIYVQGYTSGTLDPNTTGLCDQGAQTLTSCTVIIPTDQLLKYIQGGGTFTVAACNQAGSPPPTGCGPASAPVTPVLPKDLKAPAAGGATGSASGTTS